MNHEKQFFLLSMAVLILLLNDLSRLVHAADTTSTTDGYGYWVNSKALTAGLPPYSTKAAACTAYKNYLGVSGEFCDLIAGNCAFSTATASCSDDYRNWYRPTTGNWSGSFITTTTEPASNPGCLVVDPSDNRCATQCEDGFWDFDSVIAGLTVLPTCDRPDELLSCPDGSISTIAVGCQCPEGTNWNNLTKSCVEPLDPDPVDPDPVDPDPVDPDPVDPNPGSPSGIITNYCYDYNSCYEYDRSESPCGVGYAYNFQYQSPTVYSSSCIEISAESPDHPINGGNSDGNVYNDPQSTDSGSPDALAAAIDSALRNDFSNVERAVRQTGDLAHNDAQQIVSQLEQLNSAQCVPTAQNNYCENPHGLDESGFTSIIDALQQFMDSELQTGLDTIRDEIQEAAETNPFGSELTDSHITELFSFFTDIWPDPTTCQPFVLQTPSLPMQFTISCEFSDRFKKIFGFLISVYTILQLIEILMSPIRPKLGRS